jgi:mannose-6-phosphate isomerase-like protein (cupin superfamily)
MTQPIDFKALMDEKYGFKELIDIQTVIDDCTHQWFNQTLCRINDCVVRMGIAQGEFPWHKHNNEDEFFYVVEGTLFVDFEDETFELSPKQGVSVPKGVIHRTRAPERTVFLAFEGAGVVPLGD